MPREGSFGFGQHLVLASIVNSLSTEWFVPCFFMTNRVKAHVHSQSTHSKFLLCRSASSVLRLRSGPSPSSKRSNWNKKYETHTIMGGEGCRVLVLKMLKALRLPPRFRISRVTATVLISSAPRACHHDLLVLHDIRRVVTLLETYDARRYPATVKVLHVPTVDFTSPSESSILRAVAFMSGPGNVLVHCHSGKGRSAICAVAFLCRKRRWSVARAHRYVRRKHRITRLASPVWNVLREMERRGTI